jgi:hypothetical protein
VPDLDRSDGTGQPAGQSASRTCSAWDSMITPAAALDVMQQ